MLNLAVTAGVFQNVFFGGVGGWLGTWCRQRTLFARRCQTVFDVARTRDGPENKKANRVWLAFLLETSGGGKFTTEQLAIGANEHFCGFLRQ